MPNLRPEPFFGNYGNGGADTINVNTQEMASGYENEMYQPLQELPRPPPTPMRRRPPAQVFVGAPVRPGN